MLKAPKRTADLLVFAQKVHDQMAVNSASLPAPNPALAVLQGHIDDLATKEALTKTRAAGTVEARDKAKLVLKASLESERAYVEGLCNADPGSAAALVQDAGMSLRAPMPRTKPPLAVKQGEASGEVVIVAKAESGARQNQWQYSLDGGSTWIDLVPTTKAHTRLSSLTRGVTVTVRHRVFTKSGFGDWGQPVSRFVT